MCVCVCVCLQKKSYYSHNANTGFNKYNSFTQYYKQSQYYKYANVLNFGTKGNLIVLGVQMSQMKN